MLKITRVSTVYSSPSEDDYCIEGESDSHEEYVGFRELVDMMREHSIASCSHLNGTIYEWFSTEAYQDPYSGEYSNESIHYSHDNPTKMLKYWKYAMKAAGYKVYQ